MQFDFYHQTQEDCTQLQAVVNQIIHDAWQDPTTLTNTVANINPDIILADTIHKIQQCITNSHHHMREHHGAAQLQAQLQTHDIHNYFTPKVSTTIHHSQESPPTTLITMPKVCGS